MVKENCGVVGIFSLDKINVIPMLIDSLRALQHRGQDGVGIATSKRIIKKNGLVKTSYVDSELLELNNNTTVATARSLVNHKPRETSSNTDKNNNGSFTWTIESKLSANEAVVKVRGAEISNMTSNVDEDSLNSSENIIDKIEDVGSSFIENIKKRKPQKSVI